MNSPLKSPIFVVILILGAGGLFVRNVIVPMLGDISFSSVVEVTTVEGEIEEFYVDCTPRYSSSHSLAETEWQRRWERDPFVSDTTIKNQNYEAVVTPIRTYPVRNIGRVITPVVVEERRVTTEAVVSGPRSSVILYHGREYRIGDQLLGGEIMDVFPEYMEISYGTNRVKVFYNE